jgi:hypothetical protein
MSPWGKLRVWPVRIAFEGEGDVLVLASTQEAAVAAAHARRFDPLSIRNIRLAEVDVAHIGPDLGTAPMGRAEPVQLPLPFEEDV